MTSSFSLTPAEFEKQYTGTALLKTGLIMDDMEGIWLAWQTDQSAIEAALPPCLEFAAPVAMTYITQVDTGFAGPYREAALIVPCHYGDVYGAYMQSILLEGPGAPQATIFGREMAGMPKKICDSVSVELEGDIAKGRIVKDGVNVLETVVKLGEYNTPAGNEIFAGRVAGAALPNDNTFLVKYDLEQAEDGHMFFTNGRLSTTDNITKWSSWTPGTAEITLNDCPNAPWSSLPVRAILAAGYGKFSMTDFSTREIAKIDIDENIRYLLPARYERRLFS